MVKEKNQQMHQQYIFFVSFIRTYMFGSSYYVMALPPILKRSTVVCIGVCVICTYKSVLSSVPM